MDCLIHVSSQHPVGRGKWDTQQAHGMQTERTVTTTMYWSLWRRGYLLDLSSEGFHHLDHLLSENMLKPSEGDNGWGYDTINFGRGVWCLFSFQDAAAEKTERILKEAKGGFWAGVQKGRGQNPSVCKPKRKSIYNTALRRKLRTTEKWQKRQRSHQTTLPTWQMKGTWAGQCNSSLLAHAQSEAVFLKGISSYQQHPPPRSRSL